MHYSEYTIIFLLYTDVSNDRTKLERYYIINYIDGQIQNIYLFIPTVEISKIRYVLVPTYELMKIFK